MSDLKNGVSDTASSAVRRCNRGSTTAKVLKECMAIPYDAVLVNDTIALPYGVKLAQHRNVPLIFDAHEYSPGEFVDNLLWRLLWQR